MNAVLHLRCLSHHRQTRGTRIFLRMPRGDQKKLVIGDHKQTGPLPVKNDSSLNEWSLTETSSNEHPKIRIWQLNLETHNFRYRGMVGRMHKKIRLPL